MFSRVGLVGRTQVKPAQFNVQSRTMVTETSLRARIKTVTNVKKITSTMKMVAASKLRNAQTVLDVARAFQQDVVDVWPDEDADAEVPKVDKALFLTVCSDGGLCGAVNSSIVRKVRADSQPFVGKNGSGELSLALFGMKAIQGLERTHGSYYKESFTDIGKLKFLTFRQAAMLADPLLTLEYDRASVYYNLFRSAVSYDTTTAFFYPAATAAGDGKFLLPYEIEGDADTIKNFYEFRTAVRLFHFISENDTSTMSSRMNAMENSSKNAGEMLDALTLQLNRSRQARITTELIEIISGATAAEEMSG